MEAVVKWPACCQGVVVGESGNSVTEWRVRPVFTHIQQLGVKFLLRCTGQTTCPFNKL